MCSERVLLTWSISAASVVDLPEPVGPVTSTSPRALSASCLEVLGKAELGERLDLGRDHAERRAERGALEEDVDAEAADAGDRVGHVDVAARLEHLLLLGREDPVEQVARVLGREHLVVVERLELAAPANHRLRLGRQMEVRGVEILHLAHEVVDREGHHLQAHYRQRGETPLP